MINIPTNKFWRLVANPEKLWGGKEKYEIN